MVFKVYSYNGFCYLYNHSQRTKLNGSFSNFKYISAEVPLGSILSPSIFVLFVNDVFKLSNKSIEIYLYTDDTAIIF